VKSVSAGQEKRIGVSPRDERIQIQSILCAQTSTGLAFKRVVDKIMVTVHEVGKSEGIGLPDLALLNTCVSHNHTPRFCCLQVADTLNIVAT